MSRHVFAIGVAVSVWGAASALPAAQRAPHPAARYDGAAEITVAGNVIGVISAAAPDGTVGVHLDIKTPSGIVHVALGPATFIGDNNFFFIAEDAVSIVGARVGAGKEPVVWAREVTKDGKLLTLRNPDGTPRWTLATADDPDGCGVSHGPIR